MNYGSPDHTPDLRGMFLRGGDKDRTNLRKYKNPDYDNRSGGTSTQKIGSTQLDDFMSHSHDISLSRKGSVGESNTKELAWAGNTGNQSYLDLNSEDYSHYKGGIANYGGNETRPKNVYVNWIIKAKQKLNGI